MKILVYEHVSGGGYAEKPVDLSVLSEGFGMLRCLTADFKAAGHEVTALLDARISKLNPPLVADCTVPVFRAKEAAKSLVNAAEINDAVYVIAPETGQAMESLVRLGGQTGKVSLNCEADAIHRVADKMFLYETLKSSGLQVPQTAAFDREAKADEVKNAVKSLLSYPVVLKPADGVSCGGLSVVKKNVQIDGAVSKVKADSSGKRFIAQEFIHGQAASVSLLCTGAQSYALSLNRQNVQLGSPSGASSYIGGVVPLEHHLKQEAFEAAEKVASAFKGLRGYVGVDLVLARDKAYVVDVNPRLTTSYVGLSKVAGFNVAASMVNAVLARKLPAERESTGYACFSKVEVPKPTLAAFQNLTQIKGIVSPPFPFEGNSKTTSLVVGCGESVAEAELRFKEAKKRLLNITSGGK